MRHELESDNDDASYKIRCFHLCDPSLGLSKGYHDLVLSFQRKNETNVICHNMAK